MGNPGSVLHRMLRFRWIGVDPLQNSVRLSNAGFYNDFCTFSRNWGPTFRQSRLQGSKSDLQQEGNRSSSKSIYTNSRFTACVRPASIDCKDLGEICTMEMFSRHLFAISDQIKSPKCWNLGWAFCLFHPWYCRDSANGTYLDSSNTH